MRVCALVVRLGHGRLATAQISRFFPTLSTALLKKKATPSSRIFDLSTPIVIPLPCDLHEEIESTR